MSRENVELVQRIYADWARGDFSSNEWADPEIELVVADGPSPGRWRGIAAMAESWSEVLSAWEDLRAEPEEYRVLDDTRVLVLTRNSGRGKASGFELGQLQTRGANVFHIADSGMVTRLAAYWDRERAFADLGMSE